jgi:peptidoglycan/xylan/chitin deacetylase (PgdA/CDA1 family)
MLVAEGREQRFDFESVADKRTFYADLMRWLLARPNEDEIGSFVRDLAARYDVDIAALLDRMGMTWDQIRALARDPLVTIGAQSVNHPILAKISPQRVEHELRMSRAVIESAIGVAPRHFAYPFGQCAMAGTREFQIARQLGYATAMTLREGVITRAHARRLTALPRLSLDGEFQRLRYAKVAMSGVPTIGTRLFADRS